jgi:hypothetical protein
MKDEGVYLYQHYDGYDLLNSVKRAMEKRWRWDDPEYLARIIFDEMTKDCHGEECGYGIGSDKHSDIEYLITVDCENQTVTQLKCRGGDETQYSFEEFVDLDDHCFDKRGN